MSRKSPQIPLLLLLAAATSALALVSGSDPVPAGENSTEFIKSSCGATLYPDLCFYSLSRYASSVRSDPVRLAWLAANVTLGRVYSVSTHISSLRRSSAVAEGRGAAALRDCAELLGDAADLARNSAEEIGRVTVAVGPEVAWRVSNVQTWMSAVMTNEQTCADGFGPVAQGPVKSDVCGRVRWAKEYTSNALALVNKLVSGR